MVDIHALPTAKQEQTTNDPQEFAFRWISADRCLRTAPQEQHKGLVMTNVIPFVARADGGSVPDPIATARTTASVVADLVSVVGEIKEISGKVLPLPYDAREVERTTQALLDAISAIEHATEVLTNHGQRTPF